MKYRIKKPEEAHDRNKGVWVWEEDIEITG